jgi:hypothetical protein
VQLSGELDGFGLLKFGFSYIYRAVCHNVPFAVVPCCVFAELFPRNGRVTTYEQLLVWLLDKFGAQKGFLPLQGRNVVVHSNITPKLEMIAPKLEMTASDEHDSHQQNLHDRTRK